MSRKIEILFAFDPPLEQIEQIGQRYPYRIDLLLNRQYEDEWMGDCIGHIPGSEVVYWRVPPAVYHDPESGALLPTELMWTWVADGLGIEPLTSVIWAAELKTLVQMAAVRASQALGRANVNSCALPAERVTNALSLELETCNFSYRIPERNGTCDE